MPKKPKGATPLVALRLPDKLLHDIDCWRSTYPEMDRSAAIRCLIGLGLGRRVQTKPDGAPFFIPDWRRPARVRDPATERLDNFGRQSWLWYRLGEKPERIAPWRDNASNFAGRPAAPARPERHRRRRAMPR